MDYKTLRDELTHYNPALLERPSLVILNKTETEESAPLVEEFYRHFPLPSSQLFCISAQEGLGLKPLIAAITDRYR